MSPVKGGVGVVIATRNRVSTLLRSLEEITDLPDRPHVVVVDNASSDGTSRAVRARFPDVAVVSLVGNAGVSARNVGMRVAAEHGCQFVAIADDDSWFGPGSLTSAVQLLEDDPSLALIAARILVGKDERLDPTSALMASGAAPDGGLPAVTGFLACGAVVRVAAFLAAGGFEPTWLIGGEEQLLIWDLLATGGRAVYASDVVAHHHPSASRDAPARRRLVACHDLWAAWSRLPAAAAMRRTARLTAAGAADPAYWRGMGRALLSARWALARRRPVPVQVADAVMAVGAA